MKKLFSTIVIVALTAICFNAQAQKTTTAQEVKSGSYHKYTITPGSTSSTIEWIVDGTKKTDAFSDNAGTVLTLGARTTEIFLLWSGPTDEKHTVLVREISAAGCYDESVNDNLVDVTIKANDFAGTLDWDVHTANVGAVEDCALVDLSGNTTVGFKLEVSGYRLGVNCTYKYRVAFSPEPLVANVGVSDWQADVVGNFSPADLYFSAVGLVPNGDGLYYVHVQILELLDGFATPVNNLTSLVQKATLKQLPAAATIILD